MEMCVGILKMVLKRSSAVIWFEFVYVRDFDEDSEELFIFYNNIDKERIKKNTFALQGLQGYTRDTTSNLITTVSLMTWSSEVFRIFLSHVGR